MKKWAVLLFCFIFPGLKAESDLFRLIRSALENSNKLKYDLHDKEINGLLKNREKFAFLPEISVLSSFRESEGEPAYLSQEFQASCAFYLFDDRFYNLRRQNLKTAEAEINFRQAKADLAVKVIKLYYEIAEIQNKTEYYEKLKEKYEAEEEFTAELIKTGVRTELDKYSLRIEIKKLELALLELIESCDEKIFELEQITKSECKEKLAATKIELSDSFDFLSADNNFEKLKNDIEFQLAVSAKRKAFTNLLPDLYVSGSLRKSNFSFFSSRKEDERLSNRSISLNIGWDFGKLPAEITDYRIRKHYLKQAELNKILLSERLERQIMSLQNNLRLKIKSKVLQKEKLTLAEKKLKLSQAFFRSGVTDFLDYKTAENEFLQAKSDLLKAEFDLIKISAEVDLFLGQKILGEF